MSISVHSVEYLWEENRTQQLNSSYSQVSFVWRFTIFIQSTTTCCNIKWGVYWSNSGGTVHYNNLNRVVSVLCAQTRHSKITTPERNSMCTDKQQTVCTMMQVTAIPVQILRSLQWHTKFSPSVAHSSCRAGGPSG